MDSSLPVEGKPEQGPFPSLDAFTLPGASALTSQAYTKIPSNARRLSVIASYTLGAGGANGQARFRLQWQIDGGGSILADVYEGIIDGTTIDKTVVPFLENPEYLYSLLGPVVAAGTVSWRLLEVSVPVRAIGYRVVAAEVGDATHPGTVTVRGYTSDRV